MRIERLLKICECWNLQLRCPLPELTVAHKGQSQFPSYQSYPLKMETDCGGKVLLEIIYGQTILPLEVLIPEMERKDLFPIMKF